jgi:GNAT superfamily N-acetyltransferase
MPEPPHQILADLSLARRLETTEGSASAGFVEARARLTPSLGATWREIGGAYAMFDGPASPITQTFRLGIASPVEACHLDEIERFFRDRGAPVFHEVSPLADASALGRLTARGYRPVEFTSVLYRPVARGMRLSAAVNERIAIRRIGRDDIPRWIDTAVLGWSEFAEYADLMRELSRVSAEREDGLCFLAELDGRAIATGGLYIRDGVALLAGASTIPDARHQGAQLALLEHRLRFAADAGCELAMMGALPGSGSQRNAERNGFRIAYTRIKWGLDVPVG